MQYDSNISIINTSTASIATNKVLRNTYILLSLTLIFSALTAWLAMLQNIKPLNPFITLIGYFGLLFATQATRNSVWGLLSIFGLTGFMGYTLGPILNLYINHIANGHEIVMVSLGATGSIFLGLSFYALFSRKDFSFMGSFLAVGALIAFAASIAGLFFHLPVLMLTVSAMFVLIASGLILLKTSEIIHGGETNYIMATISLYVSIYNLFVSLLNLISGSSRD